MAYSLTYNNTPFSTYGLIVEHHSINLTRKTDSLQLPDRSWAGKGQAAPAVITLQVAIVGVSTADMLSNLSIIRGLLDQEEECALLLDLYTDRYWLAKFSTLDGNMVAPSLWKGTLIFTCYDGKAYAITPVSLPYTFGLNESADYGGTIEALVADGNDLYCATNQKVYKLNSFDLSFVAESASYGSDVMAIAVDSTHVYIGGVSGVVRKLLKSDLSFIADGPAYGGIIYAITTTDTDPYVFYGGSTTERVVKLLKFDMTTAVTSNLYTGGTIYTIVSDGVFIYYGGGTGTGKVRKTDIATMTTDIDSSMYGALHMRIYALALDSSNTYIYCVGQFGTIMKIVVSTMATSAISAILGNDLFTVVVQDDYVYAAGTDCVVLKCAIADLTLKASSENYGGQINCMALNGSDLLIGGATIQKVWKLDSRFLVQVVVSEDFGGELYDIREDDTYLYAACENSLKLLKVRKSDLVKVAESPMYGSVGSTGISGIAIQGEYVFIGGDTPKTVWKLNKSDLSKVCESPAYDAINCIEADDSYVYAGDSGGLVHKLNISNLTWVADSANYNTIRCMASDSTYIYAGAATDCKVRKITKSTMATAASSADLGTVIVGITCDATYVYAGGLFTANKIQKLLLTNLNFVAESVTLGDIVTALAQDDLYLYACVYTTQTVWKIIKSSMAVIAETPADTGGNGCLALDDGYLYVGGIDSHVMIKIDKRVLWHRADNVIGLTVAGTSKVSPIITLTASADNYWTEDIHLWYPWTNDQVFDWDGSLATSDELNIDSNLWYVTLNDVSAMYGMSGNFIQLFPGGNMIDFKNIIGAVTITYTDRYA